MVIRKKRRAFERIKITALGGGTGLSTLLSGLKKYTRLLTGIVTVTDDGGSSGTLRDELKVLPPGDIRNCLVALADEEQLLARLFQYRFPGSGNLKGHSFGNLFLTAMADLAGGFDRGIVESSKVLAVRGRVLPVTLEKVRLRAEVEGNMTVYGETKISRTKRQILNISLVPIERPVPASGVLKAIAEADVVVIGPGSLYTSIIPNLLVEGIAEAIANSPARVVYVCNIMTQPWETVGYKASDHYRTLERFLGSDVVDYVFLHAGEVSRAIRKRYRRQNSAPVTDDLNTVFLHKKTRHAKVRRFDFIRTGGLVRHDPDMLARAVMSVVP